MRRTIASLALVILCITATLISVPASASTTPRNGRIVYDRGDPSNPGDTSVYTSRADGSRERLLVPHTCCAGWSPDGTQLALPGLTPDGRISTATVNADGSGYKSLPIHDPTLNIGCGPGSWSPDGRWLYCEAWDDTNPSRDGIYKMRASDGGGLRRITTNPIGGHDTPGSSSPDGRRIVFVRFDPDFNSVGLFTVRVNGTHEQQITSAGSLLNIGADWSPRDEIAFSRHVTPDARGSLWVVHPDGSGLREITIDGLACGGALADPSSIGCHQPRWSPDGRKLVFASNTQTSVDIYTAEANGHGLVKVTHGGGDDPDWGTQPAYS
jgi:Tol biopolymer transport system component